MADVVITTNTEQPTQEPTLPVEPTTDKGKTFTQDELNRFLADEKKKYRAQYADYDQFKTAAQELAELKQAQLSETEKLKKQLEDEKSARLQAEGVAKERTLKAAIVAKAAELNFESPEDAYSLLDKSALTVSDNGQVEGVAEALKSLADSKKYLIKKQGQPLEPFNPSGTNQGVQETDDQKRARIWGSPKNVFSTVNAEQRGGGVVWPTGIPDPSTLK